MKVDWEKKGFYLSCHKKNYMEYRIQPHIGKGKFFIYNLFSGIDALLIDISHIDTYSAENKDMPKYYELSFCSCGYFESELEINKNVRLYPGSLCIMKNYTGKHTSTVPPESFKGFSIFLYPDEFSLKEIEDLHRMFGIDIDLFCRQMDLYPTVLSYPCDEELHKICNDFHVLLESGKIERIKIQFLDLCHLLCEKLQTTIQDKYRHFTINQIKKATTLKTLIDSDISKHHTIEKLSEQSKLCPTTLKHCFKSLYQYPPYEYLVRKRMSTAAILLRESEKSIMQISEEVGYSNASNFTRMFKKIYGVNPREYRNQVTDVQVD